MDIISRFFKGSIIGLLLMAVLLVPPGMAYAMQFSEPVKIGAFWLGKGGERHPESALPSSAADGSYYDFQSSSGVIRVWFRNGNRIGLAADSQSGVSVDGNLFNYYYEIPNDKNMLLFARVGDGSVDDPSVDIIGINKSGKWVRFVGYNQFNSMNNVGDSVYHSSRGGGPLASLPEIKAQGDSLIVNCYQTKSVQVATNRWATVRDGSPKWRYLLKWDEKAQWFGIAFEKM